MSTHELKTDPDVFQALAKGEKNYEIRLDDRGFEVGDTLILRETRHSREHMTNGAPLEYTGRTETRHITHILRGVIYGLDEGWVILSVNSPETNQLASDTKTDNNKKSRPLGWYWVKNPDLSIDWIAAKWTTEDHEPHPFWVSCGEGFEDEQCTEIGKRIPSPNEPWQVMPVEPTEEMIEEAAQAIVSWDDGCTWPDSWGTDAIRHRKDARKAFQAMLRHAPTP